MKPLTKEGAFPSHYHRNDIKSAVEWLKQRVQDMLDDEFINEYQADNFDTYIDEAFEDVMKDEI